MRDWVSQKVVLGFCIAECILTGATFVFFCMHAEVAELGSGIAQWDFLAALAGLRFVTGCAGIWGAIWRKVTTMRRYLAALCLNTLLGIFILLPMFRLDCQAPCLNFQQCRALNTFVYETSADMPPSAMNPFQMSTSVFTAPEDLGDTRPPAAKGIISFGAGKALHYFHVSSPGIIWKSAKEPICQTADGVESLAILFQKSMDEFNAALQHYSRDRFGNLRVHDGKPGAWEENPLLDEEFYPKWSRLLFQNNIGLALSEWLAFCARDIRCLAMRIRLLAHPDGTYDGQYCIYRDDAWPILLPVACQRPSTFCTSGWRLHYRDDRDCDADGIPDPYCSDGDGNVGVLPSSSSCADTWPDGVCETDKPIVDVPKAGSFLMFEKRPEVTQSAIADYLRLASKDQFGQEGDRENYLQQRSKGVCLCERGKDQGSCMSAWQGWKKPPYYWCYIDPSREQICRNQGVKMISGKDGKLWTGELCRRAGCKCSFVGVPPPFGGANVRDEDLLWPNKMNYGRECEAWNNEDTTVKPPRVWCLVGFDTTCGERLLERDQQGLPLAEKIIAQYWSRIPCHRQERHNNWKNANAMCDYIVKFFLQPCLFVLQMLFFPMFIVLRQFLLNRCGDTVSVENQFFVDVDEGDEDDFDAPTTFDGSMFGDRGTFGPQGAAKGAAKASSKSKRLGSIEMAALRDSSVSSASCDSSAPRGKFGAVDATASFAWDGWSDSLSGIEPPVLEEPGL